VNDFLLDIKIFVAIVITRKEHKSFNETVRDFGWRATMVDGIQALEENET